MNAPAVFDPQRVIIANTKDALPSLASTAKPTAFVVEENKMYYWNGEAWTDSLS